MSFFDPEIQFTDNLTNRSFFLFICDRRFGKTGRMSHIKQKQQKLKSFLLYYFVLYFYLAGHTYTHTFFFVVKVISFCAKNKIVLHTMAHVSNTCDILPI